MLYELITPESKWMAHTVYPMYRSWTWDIDRQQSPPSTENATELACPVLCDPCLYMFHVKEKYGDIRVTSYPSTCPEKEFSCAPDHASCLRCWQGCFIVSGCLPQENNWGRPVKGFEKQLVAPSSFKIFFTPQSQLDSIELGTGIDCSCDI